MKQICLVILAAAGLFSCGNSTYQNYASQNVQLDSTYTSNDLEKIISPYRLAMEAQMNEVIGSSDSSLVNYAPESPLSNFAADIVYEKGMTLRPASFQGMNAENAMVLLNFGGLRAPLGEGDVTVGNMYEIMPFDNTIMFVRLDAQGVSEMMDYLVRMNGQPVSNVVFRSYKQEQELKIGGKVVEAGDELYIITSNYLASGGDKMDFLKNATVKWDSGFLIREAFIEYVRKEKQIPYKPVEGRIVIEE